MKFCSLASGSKGNVQYIDNGEEALLVDVGMSGKYIKNALESIDRSFEKVKGILITHEHSDHISGLGVLMRRYNIPIYLNEETWNMTKGKIGKIEKIEDDLVNIIGSDKEFKINKFKILPYEISHDAVNPLGYVVESNNKKIALATDLGYAPSSVVEYLEDSDLLFIESNHDVSMLKAGKYPYFLKRRVLSMEGHLSNDDAGEVAKKVVRYGRVKKILLAHLSKENNFPDLAYESVKAVLKEGEIEVSKDVELLMTHRNKASELIEI